MSKELFDSLAISNKPRSSLRVNLIDIQKTEREEYL